MSHGLTHLPGAVHVAGDVHKLYDDVAAAMEAEAIHAVRERGVFHVALSGGSTPEKLYIDLVADPRFRMFPWGATHIWQVDERRVPEDDERSNFKMLKETLILHCGVPESQVHPMPVLADDPAGDYEKDLAKTLGVDAGGPPPRFDYVLLGMGGDLHTASLFPHSKALHVTDRWVAVNDGEHVTPPDRVTLTYPIINAARNLAVLLTGEKKTQPLQRLDRQLAEHGPDIDAMPITGVSPTHDDARLTWYLDPAAAGAGHADRA